MKQFLRGFFLVDPVPKDNLDFHRYNMGAKVSGVVAGLGIMIVIYAIVMEYLL